MNSTVRALASASPYALTAAQQAMLKGGDNFADFPLRGPPRSGVIQLASKDCDPASAKFVPGAAPGLLALRFGIDEAKAVKSFDFMPFAVEQRFNEYEPSRGTEQGQFVRAHAQKPVEAQWRTDANGRRRCLMPNGNEIKETKNVLMLNEKRVIAFEAHSSGLGPINEFLDRAVRLSVKIPVEINGKVETKHLRGPIIGKFTMTTSEERQGAYRWWLPRPTLLGKLGEPNGPSIEDYLFAAQVREGFLQGGPLWNETPATEAAPALASPAASREEGPQHPEAPPPSEYDGPGPDDDCPPF